MAALLDQHKHASWNNPELSEIVTNSREIMVDILGFCAALAQEIEAINNLHSNFERAVLKKYSLIADELLHKVDQVYRNELFMKERLHSFDNTLGAEIDCVGFSKKACAVFFTAAAAASAAAAAANANSNTAAAAAASAASVVFAAAGKWVHSLMKKRASDAMKRKEIVNVVIGGAGSRIKYLTEIHDLGGRLERETKAVMKMGDGVDVGRKVAELNRTFQEIRGKANGYGPNMNRALEEGFGELPGFRRGPEYEPNRWSLSFMNSPFL